MTDVKAAEPSIEEILASIRKIISDDDEPVAAGAVPATAAKPIPSPATVEEEEEVLELTDIVEDTPAPAPPLEAVAPPPVPEPQPVMPEPIPEEPVVTVDAPRTETPAEQQQASKNEEAPMPADEPEEENERIVSDKTFAAAAGALARITQPETSSSGGRSIEDITRDLLRPMLKAWLDQNLPALVEKLVERELKKISRKAEDI